MLIIKLQNVAVVLASELRGFNPKQLILGVVNTRIQFEPAVLLQVLTAAKVQAESLECAREALPKQLQLWSAHIRVIQVQLQLPQAPHPAQSLR